MGSRSRTVQEPPKATTSTQAAPTSGPTRQPGGAGDARKQALRQLTFDDGAKALAPRDGKAGGKDKPTAPTQAAGGDKEAGPARADVDDGGPGTTVVRHEPIDPRLGPPMAAPRVSVPALEVKGGTQAKIKADARDPQDPGRTNHMWFQWDHLSGPAWTKTFGMYRQELQFQAPDVSQDDQIGGELSVTKRGYLKARGVTTKKPFKLKVRPSGKAKQTPAPKGPVKEGSKDAGLDLDSVQALVALARNLAGPKEARDKRPDIDPKAFKRIAEIKQLQTVLIDVMVRRSEQILGPANQPPAKPPVKRPVWLPPKKEKPRVKGPSTKALQAGERGRLVADVVDPDQGKLSPPKVDWRHVSGPKPLDIKGQGTSTLEFTAPQVSKKVSIKGIVYATDADGLRDSAPFTVTVEPKVAAGEKGKVWGDPHFVGADGGKYDIMGRPGGVYNLLSDTGVRVTALFKQYRRQGITVMDKVGTTVTGKAKGKVRRNQIEFRPGAATIDGKALPKNRPTPLADGGSALYLGPQLIVDTREGYKITMYERRAGNIFYCDADVESGARGVGSGANPDGLLGQTFDADKQAKNGRRGVNAQGEGAIAGKVDDYETKGLFGAGKGSHAMGGLDAATGERRIQRKTVLVWANPRRGARGFVETGLDVEAGDTLIVHASGEAKESHGFRGRRTPDGDPRYRHPRKSHFMSPEAPAFALVGRVSGDRDGFMIGSRFTGKVAKDGKLELAFNDLEGTFGDNSGYYLADIQVVKGIA